MRLYDTARGEIVEFSPGPLVKMYSCGITPYDAAHLGHAAVYVYFDMLQRVLRDLGHETTVVRNVTDVDDDILRKARELGVHYLDLAAEEMARFDAEMALLNLLPVWSEPRATSAIPEILSLIGAALDRGFAYESGGSVYFSVSSFGSFGEVSHGTTAPGCSSWRRSTGESGGPEQARALGLRVVAAVAARRAGVGVAVGAGTARLAHRVLGVGAARARGDDRHPRRRSGPGLPAPRVRDGAVGVGDGAAVRAAVVPRRAGGARRHEDVEVAGEPGVRRGPLQGVGRGGRAARVAGAPLSRRLGLADERGHAGRGDAAGAVAQRSRVGTGRPGWRRCGRRWPRTSTRRARWRSWTPRPRPGGRWRMERRCWGSCSRHPAVGRRPTRSLRRPFVDMRLRRFESNHMDYHMVMTRREVLVQLDDDLVARLDVVAKQQGTNRSELLRRGALAVLKAVELEAADRELQAAYRRVPQDPLLVEAAERLAATICRVRRSVRFSKSLSRAQRGVRNLQAS